MNGTKLYIVYFYSAHPSKDSISHYNANVFSISRISMHVTKVAMVVDAGFVVFFIVAVVKREVREAN